MHIGRLLFKSFQEYIFIEIIARINHLTHSSKLDELKQTKKRYN